MWVDDQKHIFIHSFQHFLSSLVTVCRPEPNMPFMLPFILISAILENFEFPILFSYCSQAINQHIMKIFNHVYIHNSAVFTIKCNDTAH